MEERLIKFAHIVDAGSFTKAALRLRISQPALSATVKKLERELQTELLIRGSRSFRLTAAGAIAYETAKTLITQGQNLKLRLGEAVPGKVTLTLGMIDSIADLLFVHGAYLQELEQSTHVSLTVDNSARLISQVEHDELDMALVAEPLRLPASLTATAVGEEPLIFVTHPDHALQAKQEVAEAHLRHFVSYNQNSRTFQLVTEHFARLDITIEPSFYSTSPEIMLQLVLAGRGEAVLPYLLVRPYLEQGQLTPIAAGNSCTVSRRIIEIHRTGRLLPSQTEALLLRTRQQLQELSAQAIMLEPNEPLFPQE